MLDDPSQRSPEVQAYAAELKVSLERARQTSTDELTTMYTPAFASTLAYDPSTSANLPLIQGSKLQLDAAELAVLQQHGFALSRRQQFASFSYGYATIYAEDLPVFISADSVLDALHRSYDRMLATSQLAFINDAVVIKQESGGCVLIEHATGWYTRLFFRSDSLAFDPTIADIHTQPTDEVGNPVGRVLHAASGQPTLMVVTLDGCSAGPRAYVGLASSYHERVTENFTRLTDSEWAAEVRATRNAAPPAWSADL